MKIIRFYSEWLAGQHGGHDCHETQGWLVCLTCQVRWYVVYQDVLGIHLY
mgnify:FL=1